MKLQINILTKRNDCRFLTEMQINSNRNTTICKILQPNRLTKLTNHDRIII